MDATIYQTWIKNAQMDENDNLVITTTDDDAITIPHGDLVVPSYIYTTSTSTTFEPDICELYPYTPKPTHCPSCGAPLNHYKDRCEYCGSFY